MAIIQGDEPKFAINLTAPGFSMDTDDFDVEIVSTVGGSLKGSKGGSGTDVIIFSQTEEITVPPAEEGGEPTVQTVTKWYVIVDTSKELLPGGSLKVIGTAYVPDAHANDGVRKQTVVKTLDNFVAR
jgi:hypothetical protein